MKNSVRLMMSILETNELTTPKEILGSVNWLQTIKSGYLNDSIIGRNFVCSSFLTLIGR